MLRQRLISETKPKGNNNILISEWKIASACLIFSVIVLFCKIYYHNRDYLVDVLFERKYVSYETITEDGQIMLTYTWNTFLRYSKFWLPIVCGLLTTYFTWLMVYIDSNIPGVQPPSPFSPTKYKVRSGHTFHLNYVFALAIGFLVTIYLFTRGAQI